MLAALLLAVAPGCGGDEASRTTTATTTGTGSGGTGEEAQEDPGAERVEPSPGRTPASPRDADAQRGLRRELSQRGIGGARRVLVRGSEVTIETGFGRQRAEAAASLCIAVRRFFLKQGQGQVQTIYDIAVLGRTRATLARC